MDAPAPRPRMQRRDLRREDRGAGRAIACRTGGEMGVAERLHRRGDVGVGAPAHRNRFTRVSSRSCRPDRGAGSSEREITASAQASSVPPVSSA